MRYRFLRFPKGKPKAVTFSYDDGIESDKKLAEIFAKHGMRATFNLTGEAFGNRISIEDVKKYILENGHEIAIHGSMHRAEGLLRPIEGITDILSCRLELEKQYGRIIRGMAYPDSGIKRFTESGSYDDIRNYLKELDIAYARTLGGDNDRFELPTDWYAWMPTAHHTNPDIMKYVDKFLALQISNEYIALKYPRLFYVWGHSYEFDCNGNWDFLEELCCKLEGKDDTWYATNMEIYEYVEAYHSLVYSADSAMVYNPTLYEVYFWADGQDYCVKPGERIYITEEE